MNTKRSKAYDYYITKIAEIEQLIDLLKKTRNRNRALHDSLIKQWRSKIDDYREKIKKMKR